MIIELSSLCSHFYSVNRTIMQRIRFGSLLQIVMQEIFKEVVELAIAVGWSREACHISENDIACLAHPQQSPERKSHKILSPPLQLENGVDEGVDGVHADGAIVVVNPFIQVVAVEGIDMLMESGDEECWLAQCPINSQHLVFILDEHILMDYVDVGLDSSECRFLKPLG